MSLTRKKIVGALPWILSPCLSPALSAAPNKSVSAVKRLICIGLDLSLRPENFNPIKAGWDVELPPLLKHLAQYQNDCTVISGLHHHGVSGGHNAVHAFLSGVRKNHADNFPQGNISLDQALIDHPNFGKATRYPSLVLGNGQPISWSEASIALPKISEPEDLKKLLFQPLSSKDLATQEKVLDDENMMIKALLDHSTTKKSSDQNQVRYQNAFQARLRSVEREKQWLHKPKPRINLPKYAKTGENPETDLKNMFDVMFHALSNDSSRLITLNLGASLDFSECYPQIDQSYHSLSHTGKSPDKLKKLACIENSIMAAFSHFVDRLAREKTEDGKRLLDHSMILLGSGMGNASSHSSKKLPVLLVGGGLKHGRHLKYDDHGPTLCNIYVSLLRHLGLDCEHFGSSDGHLDKILIA